MQCRKENPCSSFILCVDVNPVEYQQYIHSINGREVIGTTQEEALEAFRLAPDPISVELIRCPSNLAKIPSILTSQSAKFCESGVDNLGKECMTHSCACINENKNEFTEICPERLILQDLSEAVIENGNENIFGLSNTMDLDQNVDNYCGLPSYQTKPNDNSLLSDCMKDTCRFNMDIPLTDEISKPEAVIENKTKSEENQMGIDLTLRDTQNSSSIMPQLSMDNSSMMPVDLAQESNLNGDSGLNLLAVNKEQVSVLNNERPESEWMEQEFNYSNWSDLTRESTYDDEDGLEDYRYDVEYEEVVIDRRQWMKERFGIQIVSIQRSEQIEDIYVGEVEVNSIAGKDGRIRKGDQILQVNSVDAESKEQVVALINDPRNSSLSFILARPVLRIFEETDYIQPEYHYTPSTQPQANDEAALAQHAPLLLTSDDPSKPLETSPGLSFEISLKELDERMERIRQQCQEILQGGAESPIQWKKVALRESSASQTHENSPWLKRITTGRTQDVAALKDQDQINLVKDYRCSPEKSKEISAISLTPQRAVPKMGTRCATEQGSNFEEVLRCCEARLDEMILGSRLTREIFCTDNGVTSQLTTSQVSTSSNASPSKIMTSANTSTSPQVIYSSPGPKIPLQTTLLGDTSTSAYSTMHGSPLVDSCSQRKSLVQNNGPTKPVFQDSKQPQISNPVSKSTSPYRSQIKDLKYSSPQKNLQNGQYSCEERLQGHSMSPKALAYRVAENPNNVYSKVTRKDRFISRGPNRRRSNSYQRRSYGDCTSDNSGKNIILEGDFNNPSRKDRRLKACSDGDSATGKEENGVRCNGSNKHNQESTSLSELYEKYVQVMYTNGANLAHTISVQQKLFEQQLAEQLIKRKAQLAAQQKSPSHLLPSASRPVSKDDNTATPVSELNYLTNKDQGGKITITPIWNGGKIKINSTGSPAKNIVPSVRELPVDAPVYDGNIQQFNSARNKLIEAYNLECDSLVQEFPATLDDTARETSMDARLASNEASDSSARHNKWVVKKRPDGTRYITRRRIASAGDSPRNHHHRHHHQNNYHYHNGYHEQRETDDETVSEYKMGRYWTREERKRQMERVRERKESERKQRDDLSLRVAESNPDVPPHGRDGGREGEELKERVYELSRRRLEKGQRRRLFDDFVTVQELLVSVNRNSKGRGSKTKSGGNPLLSVTTV